MSGAGGRAHSKNVSWSKPQEPSFLKAFKDKVGYKEPATIGESTCTVLDHWIYICNCLRLYLFSVSVEDLLA